MQVLPHPSWLPGQPACVAGKEAGQGCAAQLHMCRSTAVLHATQPLSSTYLAAWCQLTTSAAIRWAHERWRASAAHSLVRGAARVGGNANPIAVDLAGNGAAYNTSRRSAQPSPLTRDEAACVVRKSALQKQLLGPARCGRRADTCDAAQPSDNPAVLTALAAVGGACFGSGASQSNSWGCFAARETRPDACAAALCLTSRAACEQR